MTRQRSSHHVIESNFNEAIDRLEANGPREKINKKLAKEGRLKINPTTVAREAGRARTLIAHEKCAYAQVRDRIIELVSRENVHPPRTASAVIASLRASVSELKSQLQLALQGQAEHFLARQQAEKEAQRWKKEADRRGVAATEAAKIRSIRSVPGGEH